MKKVTPNRGDTAPANRSGDPATPPPADSKIPTTPAAHYDKPRPPEKDAAYQQKKKDAQERRAAETSPKK